MSVLVTGAGGFVGLNIVEQLLGEGEHVVTLSDRPLFGPALKVFEDLPGTLDMVTADVRALADVADAFKGRAIATVIHGAAITLSPTSDFVPAERAIDVNLLGTRNVLDAAAAAGVGRFVYPSSSAVYGPAPFDGSPVGEDTATRPAGVYGFTKLASERLLVDAQVRGVMDVAIGRITAVFGAWEHNTGVREMLSPPFQLAGAALRGEVAVMPSGGVRDWTSSRDVAAALLALARAPSLPSRLYNISAGKTWHPTLLADALSRRLGRPVAKEGGVEEATIAFHDDVTRVRSPIDSTRIRNDLGLTFMTPEEAVDDYARWSIASGTDALGIAR
ncbi:MAG: NAD(P)-dependent oxidoreductase [Pseudomonadota bacterium]